MFLCPWDCLGKNTGVGFYFLLQGIFPTQGSNPQFLCLLHWPVDSLPLSHQGNPHITLDLKPKGSESIMLCCSATKLCLTLQPHRLQHARLPCSSPCPRVCSNSHPSSQWCQPSISSSVAPSSSCPQSFPASGSFPLSLLFASRGQSIEASVSVLPMTIQGWFPLVLTGFISSLFKRLSWHHTHFSQLLLQKA